MDEQRIREIDNRAQRAHNRIDALESRMAVVEAYVDDLRKNAERLEREHDATRELLIELRGDVKYIRARLDQRNVDWPKIVAGLIAVLSTGALVMLEIIRRLK